MEIVLNSKFFTELSVEQLGEKTIELGYDGVDICVRPGHPIHVDNVVEALPKAMKVWQGQNLTCPLATAATDITNPNAPEVEGLYVACAEAGIPRLKIGFWRFNEGDDYWQVIDDARRELEGFSAFSEKYGVQTCYQIHSGALYWIKLRRANAPYQRVSIRSISAPIPIPGISFLMARIGRWG